MTAIELMQRRHAESAAQRFQPLSEIPSLRALVIACADQRADPTHILGLKPGEAAVIRNAGGRITPATIQMVAMMATVVAEAGARGGFELILLHHTDCGVARLAPHDQVLASYFDIPVSALGDKHVTEPARAVQADLDCLRATPILPDTLIVSGLVYDVETGGLELAVPPGPLRGRERGPSPRPA
ncbi:carbonic anhydrase [Mycobacterium riyadhense]|uniref:carbonic anhydrase n=1 Tax=Mycobacterium riyadhense TaxID=486698 RepID=A0A1X2BQR4_9MYCO|nr:carbonic anhydrase [Mycobacterium riyadhense]MCV7148653.1 carbonic anhydrase [Mycobacterium riyadhense]ORW65990.1 hypothetical protein AWC22_02145 [Mycobacterium riyadhense]